jgi:hypothetical protein
MMPTATNQAFKQNINTALGNYGIDVTLYLLVNADNIQYLDAYQSSEDRQYIIFPTKCRMEWSANTYRMRKLGLYNEKDLPILAYFTNNIDIPLHSYFSVGITYMKDNELETDRFEIIDDSIAGLSDTEILRIYKVAPLRNLSNPGMIGD